MGGLIALFPKSHGQGIVPEVVGGKLPYWIKEEDYRKIRYKEEGCLILIDGKTENVPMQKIPF